jgi:two-component sensor histidine kinase
VLRMDGMTSQRLSVSGPPILLSPKQAVGLTLALHELFTNAVKYGALSGDDGRVVLAWRRTDDPKPRLSLTWTESGGPPVTAPARRGFGSILIERALTHECDAVVTLDYPVSGLTCTIELPLPPT